MEKRPDIFKDEEASKPLMKDLICASCGNLVTRVSERIEIWGAHDYTFGNLGYPVRLGCYLNAPGCVGTGRVSNGYSWFRGYAWEIQLCNKCYSQLGWKYMGPEESFYGLIFGMLREKNRRDRRSG